MAKVTFDGTVEEILELLKGISPESICKEFDKEFWDGFNLGKRGELSVESASETQLKAEDVFIFAKMMPSGKWILRENESAFEVSGVAGTEVQWRWVVEQLRCAETALESGLSFNLGNINLRGYFNGDDSLDSVSISDENQQLGIKVSSCEKWYGIEVNEILTLANFIEHNLDGKPGQSYVLQMRIV